MADTLTCIHNTEIMENGRNARGHCFTCNVFSEACQPRITTEAKEEAAAAREEASASIAETIKEAAIEVSRSTS